LKRELLERYRAISGQPLDEAGVRVQIEGVARAAEGPGEPASSMIVPLMIAGEVHGLILLASARSSAFSWMEISFLYQAANQFSTVRLALNRMRQLAIHDPLTGVHNRRHLETELEQAWRLAARYDHDVSVVIVDVDEFKQINDAHGHLVGDQVLVEFAQIIQDVARATDIVGRYGGDEFVIVLPKAGMREATVFGQRLLQALRDRTFCEGSLRLRLTPSMGIGSRRGPSAPPTSKDLLRQADEALMSAKRAGRDGWRAWPLVHEEGSSAREIAPETPAPVRGRVLVVDDEEIIRRMVSRMLENERYEVAAEATSAGALATLAQRPNEFDVVLTDLQLKGESGIDLLHRLNDVDHTIIKVVITGHATMDNAIASWTARRRCGGSSGKTNATNCFSKTWSARRARRSPARWTNCGMPTNSRSKRLWQCSTRGNMKPPCTVRACAK
jgi:diguanylate cyclase (GGDEF)-like protein